MNLWHMNFILLTTLSLCILILIAENSNPNGMKKFWRYVAKGLKKYWKALKEWESGN